MEDDIMPDLLNKVTQGDCLEVMTQIADKSVDMILCDLPYGTTRNKWDSIIPLDALWLGYERIIKDNGAIVLTAQTPFDKVLGASNLRLLRYEWIWRKSKATGHLNAKKAPMKAHENILVFYKKLPTYNPQGLYTLEKPIKQTRPNGSNYGKLDKPTVQKVGGYPIDVIDIASTSYSGQHPTQKPVALFEYLIRTYSNEGEIVLDNCLGSGTTAVAAINTGRQFIGIEREQDYVTIANQRIIDAYKAKEEQ